MLTLPSLLGAGAPALLLLAFAPLADLPGQEGGDSRSQEAVALRLELPAGIPPRLNLAVEWDGQVHRLDLVHRSLRAEGFRVEAGAPVAVPPPRTYFGAVEGLAGSAVAASLGEGGLIARIELENGVRVLRLSPDAQRGGGWHLLAPEDPDSGEACGVQGAIWEAHRTGPLPPRAGAGLPSSVGTTPPPGGGKGFGSPFAWSWKLREAQVAFDADHPYYLKQGSDPNQVVLGVEQQLAEVELAYARDGLASYELTGIVIRDQPYYTSTNSGDFLNEFRVEWENNQPHIERDTAVLLTGYQGDGIAGLAWVGTLGGAFAYAGLFWNDGDSPGIIAHEVGHNWGAGHIDCWPWGGSAMCGSWLSLGPGTSDIVIDRATWLNLPIQPPYPIAARPFADPDYGTTFDTESITLDVLANDHDCNQDFLHLVSVDPVSEMGGTATIVAGAGPGGRDQIVYTPDVTKKGGYTDTFWYVVEDRTGLQHDTPVTIEVEPRDLVLSWKMDESGGAVATDASGRGNDGAVQGPVILAELGDPALTLSANAASGEPAANLFDNDPGTAFGSDGQGVVGTPFTQDPNDGTWLELDFGHPTTLDGFRHQDRLSSTEWIARSRLIFSDDAVFDGNDPSVEVSHHDHGKLVDYGLPTRTARYVRWEVVEQYNSSASSPAMGGKEMGFLRDARLEPIPPPVVTRSATAFGTFFASKLVDGDPQTEYFTTGQGVVTIPYTRDPNHGTWVELDFGTPVNLSGLGFLDRATQTSWIGTSRLIGSTDSTFDANDPQIVVTHANHQKEIVFDLPSGNLRYLRWEVLSKHDPGSSSLVLGGREMRFFGDAGANPGYQWVPDVHGNSLELQEPASVRLFSGQGLPVFGADSWTLNLYVDPAQPLADGTWLGGLGAPASASDERRYFEQTGGTVRFAGVDSGAVLTPGAWRMLTASYDGAELRLFVDGVEAASATAAFADALPEVHLAAENPANPSARFLGRLDEFSVWNYALSTAEVADLWTGGRATAPSPADALTLVSQAPTLAWIAALNGPLHHVYLGTDHAAVRDATPASPEYQGSQPTTSFGLSGLNPLTWYFWRVDEDFGGQVLGGDVWRFKTGLLWTTDVLEGFAEGADGDHLNGLGGGTGFAGPWDVPAGNGFKKRDGSIGAYPSNVPFQEAGGYFEKKQRSTLALEGERPLDGNAVNIDLGGTSRYYLSFALQLDGASSDPVGLVGLRNSTSGQGLWAGVDGRDFVLSGDLGAATGDPVPENQTWFLVLRIDAEVGQPDVVHLKVYSAISDLVHASDDLLSGVGPGPDQWTLMSSGADTTLLLDELQLVAGARSGLNDSTVRIDEIRVGQSWTAVTGL